MPSVDRIVKHLDDGPGLSYITWVNVASMTTEQIIVELRALDALDNAKTDAEFARIDVLVDELIARGVA